MEKICNVVKDFILQTLPIYLKELEDEASDVPLPAFNSDSISLGVIDLDRYKQNQNCAIIPDMQNIGEESLKFAETRTNIDIYFFCRNNTPDVLYKQPLRYATALKRAIYKDFSLGGNFSECMITELEYYDDVGLQDKRITGARIGLTVINEE